MKYRIDECKIEKLLNGLEDEYNEIMAHMEWKYGSHHTEYKLNDKGVYEEIIDETTDTPPTRKSRIF